MKTIYRYELTDSVNIVNLPCCANVISADVDINEKGREVICIWAEIDTSDTLYSPRKFCIFGTGADMNSLDNFSKHFIGTVRRANKYAFHVYEVFDDGVV